MTKSIDIDLNRLTQLYPFHTERELAKIFGCSRSAIQVRLRKVGLVKPFIEQPKAKPKRKFTPGVRDYLFESYL